LRRGAGGEEAIILDEEYERGLEWDGVFAPEHESEGEIDTNDKVGDVTTSLLLCLFGIGMKEWFTGFSIV